MSPEAPLSVLAGELAGELAGVLAGVLPGVVVRVGAGSRDAALSTFCKSAGESAAPKADVVQLSTHTTRAMVNFSLKKHILLRFKSHEQDLRVYRS